MNERQATMMFEAIENAQRLAREWEKEHRIMLSDTTNLNQILYDEIARDLKAAWGEMAAAGRPNEYDVFDHARIDRAVTRINKLRGVAAWLVEDKSATDHAGIVHRYSPDAAPAADPAVEVEPEDRCCYASEIPECRAPADWVIHDPKNPYDDTFSCVQHLNEMLLDQVQEIWPLKRDWRCRIA